MSGFTSNSDAKLILKWRVKVFPRQKCGKDYMKIEGRALKLKNTIFVL